MAMRNTRTPRETTDHQSVFYGAMGREPDSGTMQDVRHGLRWLLGGVAAFFLGVVLGEVWPSSGPGPRDPGPRTAQVASQARQPVATQIVQVGLHRLAVPSNLLTERQVDAARRSRGGFVTYLAWADPGNPTSEASRRCIEARPRCRDSLTMVVTTNRTPVEQQWANARRALSRIAGGEAYGVQFYTGRPGPDGRPSASIEFGERTAEGQVVYGRCPRSRRDMQDMAAAQQAATVDPGANCTLTFDVRPGLSVTLMVRGERLPEWRRAQVAAANLVETFAAAGASSPA
jgi:hypothetical protein